MQYLLMLYVKEAAFMRVEPEKKAGISLRGRA
jgi:hypothetical protein